MQKDIFIDTPCNFKGFNDVVDLACLLLRDSMLAMADIQFRKNVFIHSALYGVKLFLTLVMWPGEGKIRFDSSGKFHLIGNSKN